MPYEPAAVYRTTDPDILAAWDAEVERRNGLYVEAVKFADAVDPQHQRKLLGDHDRETFLGLSHDPAWPVPTGWTAHTGPDRIVPNKRTKTGEHAAAVLNRLSPGDPRHALYKLGLPGPNWARLDGRTVFVRGGLLRTDNAIYTSWAVDPTNPDATFGSHATVDQAKWVEAPLSEYYTALEQHRAQPKREVPVPGR